MFILSAKEDGCDLSITVPVLPSSSESLNARRIFSAYVHKPASESLPFVSMILCHVSHVNFWRWRREHYLAPDWVTLGIAVARHVLTYIRVVTERVQGNQMHCDIVRGLEVQNMDFYPIPL